MKRVLAVVGVFVILALDWLALDDITTGHQPNFYAEWTFLLLSLPALWALCVVARKRRAQQHPA